MHSPGTQYVDHACDAQSYVLCIADDPDPPIGVRARAIDSRTIEISWQPPPTNGAHPVIGHSVQYWPTLGKFSYRFQQFNITVYTVVVKHDLIVRDVVLKDVQFCVISLHAALE